MPYQRCEPVPEAYMRQNRYLGHFTICEKLREIWRMTDPSSTEDIVLKDKYKDIQFKCREAVAQAKKMHYKLKSYRDLAEMIEKGEVIPLKINEGEIPISEETIE